MQVQLSKLPDPPKEYAVEFPKLDGGLNIQELAYRLQANESPEMQNLWWRDGALCSRDGQTRLTGDEALGEGFSCCDTLFWGRGFFHIGDGLWCGELTDPDMGAGELELTELVSGVPEAAGSWFCYGDKLYYKCPGGYYAIRYDRGTDTFTAAPVEPYSPIIQINTDPDTHAGDTYQPENRICGQKTVWYTAKSGVKVYHLPVTEADSVDRVEVDETELAAGTGYTVDLAAGTVTFTTAPPVHSPAVANTVKITYTNDR